MSENKASSPPQPPSAKESLVHEALEGILDVAAWETMRSLIWKILKQIWNLFTQGALSGAKEATKDIVAGKIKKPFNEIRAEVYAYIDTVIRQDVGDEPTDAFYAHLERRRLGQERPYGDHKKYGPLEEYNGWSVLMAFYSSLQENGTEENQRREVFSRIVRCGPKAFDDFVEDLTHDVVRQAWLWVLETTAPAWKKIRSFWLLVNQRLKAAMVLFVGLPIWLILGEVFLGVMNHAWAWGILIFAGVMGCAWGWFVFRDYRRNRRARNSDPNSGNFWRAAFGWGSLGLLPIIFLIGIIQDTSLFSLSYLVPWIMGITFAVGIFWLVFGDQPLFALLLHYLGEWPKYGKPLRRILKDFGAAILFNLLFALFIPLGHLHEHPLLAVGTILMTTAFFWAVYAERNTAKAALGCLILAVFAWGFITSGEEVRQTLRATDTAAKKVLQDKKGWRIQYPHLSKLFPRKHRKVVLPAGLSASEKSSGDVNATEESWDIMAIHVPSGGIWTEWTGPGPYKKARILPDIYSDLLWERDLYANGRTSPPRSLPKGAVDGITKFSFRNNSSAPVTVWIKYQPAS